MGSTVAQKRGRLHRIAAEDFSFVEEALKTAELLIVPEDQTQRAAFEKLMPHLYVLRNKGCSWPQLTTLLSKAGFKLQPSTVRTYYSEMLVKSMNLCQARMNQQIDLMAKLREENAQVAAGSSSLSTLAQRVTSQMAKLQQQNSKRMNEMFGDPSLPATSIPTTPVKPASTPLPEPVPVPTIAPKSKTSEESADIDQFGLLGLGSVERSPDRPAGFFSLDTESTPDVTVRPKTHVAHPSAQRKTTPSSDQEAVSESTIKKRCAPLISSIVAMKKRENVPKEVYEPGEMDHPAIPGLILTLEERIYGAALEYCDTTGDEAGVYRTETAEEKRFRVTWRKVVPMTQTRTADSFMQLDTALFKQS